MRLGPAVVNRSVGSIPDPIRAHCASTTISSTFYTTESEVIDVIAGHLALDDHGQLGQHLCQLEAAVVFLLRDLAQLANGQQKRRRDPVVGLNSDRVDPHGHPGCNCQSDLPVGRIAFGRCRGWLDQKPEQAR